MNDELKKVAAQTATSPEQMREALHQDMQAFVLRTDGRIAERPRTAAPAAPQIVETSSSFATKGLLATALPSPPGATQYPGAFNEMLIVEDGALVRYDVNSVRLGEVTE